MVRVIFLYILAWWPFSFVAAQDEPYPLHHVQVYPFEIVSQSFCIGYEYLQDRASAKTSKSYNSLLNISLDHVYYELNLDRRYYLATTDTFELYLGWIKAGELTAGYFLGPSLLSIKHNKDIALGLRMSNGCVIQFTRGFSLSLITAIGPSVYVHDPYPDDTKPIGAWVVNLAVGWRF